MQDLKIAAGFLLAGLVAGIVLSRLYWNRVISIGKEYEAKGRAAIGDFTKKF